MGKFFIVARKLLWFLAMFTGLLFITHVMDNDTWFLLNSGRYVLEHGIPHVEPFTIHEDMHFVMSPWLTCVIFWKIYSAFGSGGLLTFAGIVGAVMIYLYYRLCLLVSGGNQTLSRILAFCAGFMICLYGWITTRPQILSTLFALAEVFLLEKFVRSKNVKYLLPIPLMSLALINLHAALWPMMFIMLLPYLAGSFHFRKFDAYFSSGDVALKPLLLTAAGILLAGFCNPYGTEAMTYSIHSFDLGALSFIGEMHSPTIHSGFGAIFFVWSAVLILLYARNLMPLRYVLLTAGLMFMGLQTIRSLLLFFVAGTFPMAYALRGLKISLPTLTDDVSGAKSKRAVLMVCFLIFWFLSAHCASFISDIVQMSPAQEISLCVIFLLVMCVMLDKGDKQSPLHISALPEKCVTALLLLIFLISFGAVNSSKQRSESGEYLKPAVDALLENESAEKIILWTGFNTGGYAEFRGIRCYLDPRAEIFRPVNSHLEKDIIEEYLDLRSGKLYYKDFFARYNFTHVLVTENDMFVFQALSHDADYRLIHEHEEKHLGNDVKCKVFEYIGQRE